MSFLVTLVRCPQCESKQSVLDGRDDNACRRCGAALSADRPARVSMEDVMRDGRFDPASAGLEGAAGFMGRGSYSGQHREPGYRSR
jgi:hypothetical protein